MLKERHRYRVAPSTPRTSRVPHRSNIVPLDDVGIVPGNRFILLPLKKVSTLYRRHRCCGSSATSTKTCIIQKATMVSQSALSQTAPPAHRVVSTGVAVLGLKNVVQRPGSVRSSNRLIRRASLKQRHPHRAVVKTCLSPVSEQEQEDNSFVREFLLDQGNWNQENRQPVDSLKKFKGSLHSATDKDLADIGQFSCKRVENERILKNEVSKADRQPTSMSWVYDNSLWSNDSLGQDENARRLDAHNAVSNTRNYDIFIVTPDLCTKPVAGSTDRICDDDSVLRRSPSLQETRNVSPSLQRVRGIPRATTTIDYLSLVLIESDTNSTRSKRLSQQSSHASSGPILLPDPVSSVDVTNCNSVVEVSTKTSSSKDITIVEAHLGRHLEQLKGRDIDRKGLELEAMQRVLLNRIRQSPGDSQQDTYLTVLDQFVTKNQSFNNLVDELQKENAKAQFSAERDSAHVIRSNQEHIRRAAALKQENVLRGEQQTVFAHHQRRANKKLRKMVPRIQTFGRNRVLPSSRSVGHKALQVKSIGQQFLPPPQMPENSKKGGGEFDKREVRKSGRFRNADKDFRTGDQGSAVTCAAVQKRTYLKGFLCSLANDDDLPIGPLRRLEEQLLN